MSIPFSIAFDFTLGKHLSSFGIQYLVGSFMVVLGFFLVNVTYYFPDDLQYFDSLHCFKRFFKKKEKKVIEIN
jgi:hypothetical protein